MSISSLGSEGQNESMSCPGRYNAIDIEVKALLPQYGQSLGHLDILDTWHFTAWHRVLSACIRDLDEQIGHVAPTLHLGGLLSATKGFWKDVLHLTDTMLQITKALVVFLQSAIKLGGFGRGNVHWAREVMGRLRSECHRVVAAVYGLVEVREAGARKRIGCDFSKGKEADEVGVCREEAMQTAKEASIFTMGVVDVSTKSNTLRQRRAQRGGLEVVTMFGVCASG